MTCINAAASALDTNPANYTVDVDLGNGQHKYVVYDNLAEAQADIQAHANVGLIWNNGQYVQNPNSTFTAASTTPAPVNLNGAPATGGATIPGSAINATPAAPVAATPTGTQVTTGDITAVTLTKSGAGAAVNVKVSHNTVGEQMTYDLMLNINGTWIKLKTYGPFPGDPNSYDTSHDFTIDYAELNQILQSQMPAPAAGAPAAAPALTIGTGAQIGIDAKFPTGHDQGVTGGGSNGGPFNLP